MIIDKKEVNRLVKQIKRGDEESFNVLYECIRAPLSRFVWEYVKDEDAVNDILHNTFLNVIQGDLKNLNNCYGWIFTIARNLSINYLNKSKFEIATGTCLLKKEVAPTTRPVEGLDLKFAVASLSMEERELLALRYAADYPFRVLAEIYYTSETSMKRKMNKILDKLREKVS